MASTIKVDSKKLEQMCKATIDSIKKRREKDKRAIVESAYRRHERWRKWLPFLREHTHQEIYDSYANERGLFTAFDMADWYAWGTYGIADRLLTACAFAPEVEVDIDDLRAIS